MESFINKLDKVISKISLNFPKILFIMIIIGMLAINSIYLYIDSAGFKTNNIWNYIGIAINLIIIIGICFFKKKLENMKNASKIKKYGIIIGFLIYCVGEIVFIKLVPLKPFSDMLYVTQIALSNFTEGIEYLQRCSNNLAISLIFNLIFRITKYDVIVLKIVNIICNMITVYLAYKIYQNIYKQKSAIVILLGLGSISTFLYVNNTYNDIIFTTLTTLILYLATKEEQTEKDILMIAILLFLQYIIRPVGIIIIIAIVMYDILKKKDFKSVAICISIFIVLNMMYVLIQKKYIPEPEENMEYPIWSYIQMGINEEEFGFQNSSHSVDWTFQDVQTRIKDLGAKRLITLLAKKTFWLWTEGTYQVERYAFGSYESEYFYETKINNELKDIENSKIRKALEYLMKGQYFLIIVLSLAELMKNEKNKEITDKRDLLLYVIIGMFCFYMIWEIKSRYIYCLYPIFLILATAGMNKILSNQKDDERRKNYGKFQKNRNEY